MKRLLVFGLMALSLALPACTSDGQISFLGYNSGNLYDSKYKTVQVNIFQNRTLYRGLEFELAQDLVNQIQSISPMRVVDCNADLILNGKILTVVKQVTLADPNNAIRAGTFSMTAEVVLTDGHTGELLSKPPRRPLAQPGEDLVPFINDRPDIPGLAQLPTPIAGAAPPTMTNPATIMPPSGTTPATPGTTSEPITNLPTTPILKNGQVVPPTAAQRGVVVRATSEYIPELGQSTLTCYQRLNLDMAIQIVHLMEKPW
jgi:hypothetical protein